MRVKLIACERVINLTGLLSGGVSRGIKMAVSKATDRTAVRTDITHSPTEYSCFYIRKKEVMGWSSCQQLEPRPHQS